MEEFEPRKMVKKKNITENNKMNNPKDSGEFHSIRIIDEEKKCYRDYHFIKDSQDIQNKILNHIIYFGQNTKFHDHKEILQAFTSLCHKVNIVKYHLKRYKEVEKDIETELFESEHFIDHDGRVLIERIELTAEYESFLIQVKATLDILVKFLNIIYRNGQKNPIKFQSTFSDGGKGVIKALENFLKHNQEDEDKLLELIRYLKSECFEYSDEEPKAINWLITTINIRDRIAHFRKSENFAFQITYIGIDKTIIRPKLTQNQTVSEFFEIVYDNLLVFIQDFISLLFIPYLDKPLMAFTFKNEDVGSDAPRWYLQLGEVFPPNLVWQNMGNLSIITSLCKNNKGRLTPDYCEKMYLYYAGFYKRKGFVITSRGIEDHTNSEKPKLCLEFKD